MENENVPHWFLEHDLSRGNSWWVKSVVLKNFLATYLEQPSNCLMASPLVSNSVILKESQQNPYFWPHYSMYATYRKSWRIKLFSKWFLNSENHFMGSVFMSLLKKGEALLSYTMYWVQKESVSKLTSNISFG